MFVADEAHVTNIAVHPDHRRDGIATRLLGRPGRRRHRPRLRGVDARGARQQHAAPRRCTGRSASRPAGIRARYYENTEDAIVMWCHDIQIAGVRRAPRRAATDDR